MSRVYSDENNRCRIDLSSADWATDELHELYKTIGNELADVDWIAETANEIYLIEYKNTSFVGKNGKNEFYIKIWKKYYGSAFYMLARGNIKPINFYCVVEPAIMDSVQRKRATASIKKRLPYELQDRTEISATLINDFSVISIDEWNEKYPEFPIEILEREDYSDYERN